MADEPQQVDPNPAARSAESPAEAMRRVDRHQQSRRSRRIWLAVAGLAVITVVVVAGWGAVRLYQDAQSAPPERIVVIGETSLEDGTIVAGPVVVIEPDGTALKVTSIDAARSAAIPGTSYDRLSDALPMGGPELVSQLVLGEDAEKAGWIVLEQDGWAALIDAAGGADVEVPGETTVFTGDRLFRFEEGLKKLTGDEAVAIALGAETFDGIETAAKIRLALGAGLGDAAISAPDRLVELIESGQAESSEDAETLTEYLGGQ